jgi:molybdopterin-guanine dinucleotide biosynthesis protein A
MPGLSVAALCWLIAQTADIGEDTPDGVAISGSDNEPEPLFSLYTTAVLPEIYTRLKSGRRSLRGLIQTSRFAHLTVPTEYAAALINVNTPEELAAYLSVSYNN